MGVEILFEALRLGAESLARRSLARWNDTNGLEESPPNALVAFTLAAGDLANVGEDLVEHHAHVREERVQGRERRVDGQVGRGARDLSGEGGEGRGEEVDAAALVLVNAHDGLDGEESEVVCARDDSDRRGRVGGKGERGRVECEVHGGRRG